MVEVFKNAEELSKRAAALFCQTAIDAVEKKGKFTVALTGGSSPVELYKLLTTLPYADQVQWDKTFVFWGDERWVPLTDEKSNAKMSYEALLDHVPIPKENIFPMWNNERPVDFAMKYEQQIKDHFGGKQPEFDLILLGMGDDGHTASLFPGTDVLNEQTSLVSAYYLPAQSMYRITLTAPCINLAKRIIFLIFGDKKANALHEVLEGMHDPKTYPSQFIKPSNGEVIWLVDEAAASRLGRVTTG